MFRSKPSTLESTSHKSLSIRELRLGIHNQLHLKQSFVERGNPVFQKHHDIIDVSNTLNELITNNEVNVVVNAILHLITRPDGDKFLCHIRQRVTDYHAEQIIEQAVQLKDEYRKCSMLNKVSFHLDSIQAILKISWAHMSSNKVAHHNQDLEPLHRLIKLLQPLAHHCRISLQDLDDILKYIYDLSRETLMATSKIVNPGTSLTEYMLNSDALIGIQMINSALTSLLTLRDIFLLKQPMLQVDVENRSSKQFVFV